jgi:hypothetical protein
MFCGQQEGLWAQGARNEVTVGLVSREAVSNGNNKAKI